MDAAWVTLSLAVYGVLSQEVGATIEAADCELLARQERVIHFNGLLKKHCAELGVEYIDIFDEMTEARYLLLTSTCHLLPLATYRLPTASLPPPYRLPCPPRCPLGCRPLAAPFLRSDTTLHCPLTAPHAAHPSGPEREHRVRADFLDVSEPNIHPVCQHA